MCIRGNFISPPFFFNLDWKMCMYILYSVPIVYVFVRASTKSGQKSRQAVSQYYPFPQVTSMSFFRSDQVDVLASEDRQLAGVTKWDQTSLNGSVLTPVPLWLSCETVSLSPSWWQLLSYDTGREVSYRVGRAWSKAALKSMERFLLT